MVDPEIEGDLASMPKPLLAACIEYLSTLGLAGGPVIIDVEALPGYLELYYSSLEYYQSRDPLVAPMGNVPLIVDIQNRAVYLARHNLLSTCVDYLRSGRADMLTRII